MVHVNKLLMALRESSQARGLREWLELEVEDAQAGQVVLRMLSRPQVASPEQELSAGVIGALLEAGCGFAAATLADYRVLSLHFSVTCLKPAFGGQFLVRAKVSKRSLNRVFAVAQVFAICSEAEEMVATGGAVLTVCTLTQAETSG